MSEMKLTEATAWAADRMQRVDDDLAYWVNLGVKLNLDSLRDERDALACLLRVVGAVEALKPKIVAWCHDIDDQPPIEFICGVIRPALGMPDVDTEEEVAAIRAELAKVPHD